MRTRHDGTNAPGTQSDRGHTRTLRGRSALDRCGVLGETKPTAAAIDAGRSLRRDAPWSPIALIAVTAGLVGLALPSRPLWSGLAAAAGAVVAATVAWMTARTRSRGAAIGAGVFASVGIAAATSSGGGQLAAVAAVGLGAAAGVDLVERRIPTAVAHTTTGVSALGLAASAQADSRWHVLAAALAATAVVVAVYAVLWLVGGVGFGDVRLAAATLSAGTGGLAYVSGMVLVPMALIGVAGLVRVAVGRRGPLPLGPALWAGWMLQVWET